MTVLGLAAAVIVIAAGWARRGLAGLAAASAAVWLAWLGVLLARGGFAPDSAALRQWTLIGGAGGLALGYAAVLGAGRRRSARRAAVQPGVVGAESPLPLPNRRGAADPVPSRPPVAPPVALSVSRPAAGPAEQAAASPAAQVAGGEGQAQAAAIPADPAGPLTGPELDRYARHIALRELGGAGQRRLRAARVLVVGAGGLGAPVLQYLGAAGAGRITVADDDTVSLSNLQRQVIFSTADIGHPKAEAAAAALARLNPHIAVTPLLRRVERTDRALVADHDLVMDGTDSFASRAGVNAACVDAGVPLIAGAIAQWEGQVALYDPARGGPCLACLFPQPPAPGLAPSCAEAGVVGALAGVIGSIMAIEAVKLIGGVIDSGAGAGLRGKMLIHDGLWGDTRLLTVAARLGCAVCGGKGA